MKWQNGVQNSGTVIAMVFEMVEWRSELSTGVWNGGMVYRIVYVMFRMVFGMVEWVHDSGIVGEMVFAIVEWCSKWWNGVQDGGTLSIMLF